MAGAHRDSRVTAEDGIRHGAQRPASAGTAETAGTLTDGWTHAARSIHGGCALISSRPVRNLRAQAWTARRAVPSPASWRRRTSTPCRHRRYRGSRAPCRRSVAARHVVRRDSLANRDGAEDWVPIIVDGDHQRIDDYPAIGLEFVPRAHVQHAGLLARSIFKPVPRGWRLR
jgi:hypothetical protein